MAKKARVYDGSQWIDLASSTTDLSNYANLTTTPISGFRNAIINGSMVVAQRGASAGTGSGRYPADRFYIEYGAGTYTTERVIDGPPAISPYSLKVTATTPGTRNSTDYYQIVHNIEGQNVMQFGFGNAGASDVVLSFWVKSSVTGIYSGTLSSGSNLKCFAFTYTVNSANTWERKTVNISGDIAGGISTYPIDNTTGLRLRLALGNGTNYNASATGSWLTETNKTSVAGAVGWAQTSGATFFLTGVQLERGTIATPFEQRPIGTELALCQRYYVSVPNMVHYGLMASASEIYRSLPIYFPVSLRAAPTAGDISVTWVGGYGPSVNGFTTNTFAASITIGNTTGVAYISAFTVNKEL